MAHVIIIIGKLDNLKAKVEQADEYIHNGIDQNKVAQLGDWLENVETDLDNGNTLGYEERIAEFELILPE